MAAPTSVTLRDLSGTFIMNKSLSSSNDAMDKILELQGIGWIARKAASAATITVKIKHTTNASGIEMLDIVQSTGPASKTDSRILDGNEYTGEGPGGQIAVVSRRVTVSDIQDSFLKSGWDSDSDGVIEIKIRSTTAKKPWSTHMIWGFHQIDSKRRFTRCTRFVAGKEVVEARLVHDYTGA